MDSPVLLISGLVCVYLALVAGAVVLIRSQRTVSLDRRRPGTVAGNSALTKATDTAVAAINRGLKGRDLRFLAADKFEQAGLKIRTGDFLLMCGAGALAAGILGFLIGGLALGLLLALIAPGGLLAWLNIKASKRQASFAEQLPDTIQSLAGSLRAGHSFLRAVDGLAEEAEPPMSQEMRRVVNETRIGRDLVDSLVATSARMRSQDFLWTAQAVETHREVGGNLAEVLENVNETIRERAQLARQVRAISAEGRMSAGVLLGLPVVMLVGLSLINPHYASTFFTTPIGWLMIAGAVTLLGIGAFWLSRLIKPKF
ncbi:type II secretion system F family protein [Sinomonas atrocyanea]|uniref:type II secretion system F family protein n=1 Tax=Sinomonas atrocyanea TaxID=37927 RepID=UPI002862BF2C|nr:type II secretion system F family protein [Sinomonas atrocyanea]MDR6620913.1 tight adherence protein B [Sinomonas atrocyanea]